jgi:hypothetical protein
MRTSSHENPIQAKLAEWIFHALALEIEATGKGGPRRNQRATRERRRSCPEDRPPTNTIASGDESAMNVPGKQTSQNPLNAANVGEFTFFAARDLRGTFLLLPADDGPLES